MKDGCVTAMIALVIVALLVYVFILAPPMHSKVSGRCQELGFTGGAHANLWLSEPVCHHTVQCALGDVRDGNCTVAIEGDSFIE